MRNPRFLSKLVLFITILLVVASVSSCSNGGDPDPSPNPTPTPTPTPSFSGPTYPDNYSSIASWNSNSQWNLANVHDPSVEKCGEYYYMYQTDASYGNATDGHGHFFYRRSKDLVNWEFMGSAMTTAPAWVKDSLNNKRARMVPALPPRSEGGAVSNTLSTLRLNDTPPSAPSPVRSYWKARLKTLNALTHVC